MKILLIDPPYAIFTGYDSRFFPVGLSYIGAVLKGRGHDVAIYDVDRERGASGDLNLSEEYARLALYMEKVNDSGHEIWKQMSKVVEDFDPDTVGITSMTMKFASVVRTAELCKKVKPHVPVIVGGPHATDWPEICFQSSSIDFCVSGEGEETISELVEAIENNRTDLRCVPGVSFRQEGAVILREQSPFVTDLDKSPHPGRGLLLNQDSYSSEDMGVIMTSRGCPYKCGFCSHPPRVRYRNLDDVILEIKDTREKYGTRQFAVKDDSFTVHRKRTVQFCETLIREKLDISWECTTRVNLIDDELLDIMQRANCNTIKVGIETGSERILKEVNKGVTFEQMRKAADLLNRHGFFWSAYFMYGLPTETKADMMKTLEFMKELNPPYAGLGLYAPMPNTQLWDSGLAHGLVASDIKLAHFFETNPKDYFFKDYKKRVVNIEYDEFVEVAEYLMKEFNKHNTHWLSLVRRGWSRRNTYEKDPKLLMSDVKKALKWAFGLGRG